MLSRLLQLVTILTLTLYPILIYFGLNYWGIELLAPLLMFLFCLRLFFIKAKIRQLIALGRILALVGILLVSGSWLLKQNSILLYYPVVVNLVFLIIFATSLTQPQTIVERLARFSTPDLPPQAVAYTRKVTLVWSLFFIVNGALSLWSCLIDNPQLWALYNGLISYILIMILMCLEWIIRLKAIRRFQ